ncbi:NAD-specific glutamate dehydrogenase [Smittium mucronatum]|uniref:NAD-specific glutamate dehydrogenase n=1 Tax=Smittium mucronatum TaxID=133383 RepID=A0A1R0GY72_9FUNG|nr:NAD-specific glutamate dehydrogenase [Smittium mucronatum]
MVTVANSASEYSRNVFGDKKQHMDKVIEILNSQGLMHSSLVNSEVEWFYESLGMDDLYFMMEKPSVVADHILGFYASRLAGISSKKEKFEINFDRIDDESAVFIHTSTPGVSRIDGPHYEQIIDENYLDISNPKLAYRLETYRSTGTISDKAKSSVRAYFVNKCDFVNPAPDSIESRDINQVGDKIFLAKVADDNRKKYQELINLALERTGPVIQCEIEETLDEHRILIAYRQGSTSSLFAGLSDLYHYNGFYSSRKYVEQFSNGITVISLSLVPSRVQSREDTLLSLEQVVRGASLLYCLPNSPLQIMFKKSELSVQEVSYSYICWIFAQHFLNRLGSEFTTLSEILGSSAPENVEILNNIKKRLRQETFTRETILSVILTQAPLIKLLYNEFAIAHYVSSASNKLRPSLSMLRLSDSKQLSDEEIDAKIVLSVHNSKELLIMRSFHQFNKHVLKTNFYQPTKVALSFRMSPGFLPKVEYPESPYGIFLIVGAEFRGFHVRFQDISRGGLRIIRSRDEEAYTSNQRSLFDENYALALTQHRKNKDIPEGGAKGTILLNIDCQDKPFVAFEKYVDSILDLILVGNSPGIKERIVDLYGKEEILFFGPDEGSAGFMDWASKHAKHRGASFWKAFTTGKSQDMGGIPHDKYAMTTNSVHQYVLGILRKLSIDESTITKFQTGGPDGDLGSNEIIISKDKTTSIVDGNGVLHDPSGINREELLKLAKNRKMIDNFDISKLGNGGFRVLVDETKITLPDGTFVLNGLDFRNTYHTSPYSAATLFVPCGGRPESIDVNNVSKLISSDGVPRFKYIVEGANLFFTQDARIRIEKAGAVLFKDASSNKGGVTSSSLEVLSALSFSDDEHRSLMCTQPDGSLPEFYQKYVKEVQNKIIRNARLEFECIWKESLRTGKPKCVLSDEVSKAIVIMRAQLESTSLWDNLKLRNVVLEEALPPLILQNLGLETIMKRVPQAYLKSIFSAHLASGFIYEFGTEPTQFSFFEYMSPYYSKAK